MPTLTASIVTYCTPPDEVQRAVDALALACVACVYIVDNSPTDTISSCIKHPHIEVCYIHGHGNVGFGAGHNIAIRQSIAREATYHLVLNSDIEIKQGVIEELTTYMEQYPDVGMTMPKVRYPNGNLQYVACLIPSPLDLIARRFLPNLLTKRRMNRLLLQFTKYEVEMNAPYLMGCFLCFRLSALQEVGLFDEQFFMYPEDIDITRRMHEHYRTIYYPHVEIVHHHAAASRHSIKMLRIHITNMIKYFNKWGWVVDKKRKATNRAVLKSLNYKA